MNSAVINVNMTGSNSPSKTECSVSAHCSMDKAAPTDKVLSVSGKKKCSHCNMELGMSMVKSQFLFNCSKYCY